MALSKADAAAYRKLVAEIVAHPADEIRVLAVQQRSLAAEALRKVRDKAGELVGRWSQYDALDSEIAAHLADGDRLESSQKEEDRIARRRQYAYAYLQGRELAQQVDAERKDGSTYVAWFADSAKGAADAAAAVGKKAGDAVAKVGGLLEDGVTLFAFAGALALVLYASNKGKR